MQMELSALTIHDIPDLEDLEGKVCLAFWGAENYRKFIEEYPDFFGCKATVRRQPAGASNMAGFLLARAIYGNLEVLKLGVSPQYQRQGIGTRLMEAAYEEGIYRGCRRCFLEVRKSNLVAIQFYSQHDFHMAGVRKNYYSEPVEDAWVMERLL